ncbi:hypothetical protein [Thioflexithrix psekupsensis]|uniref:Uncharacterized protein n=1 Tax=Thioflexithrix psekupsensis TaxID=1570016 RepID=A0A251XBH9_9GAMM|nr:hypothetical protein [Thioflexithrix psekupsensis]OUD15653.1 hypothetical protein TPSD3_03800 [Thioflexithrix psekupsensis]
MYAHRIKTTITASNHIDLTGLPFIAGEQVEVIILKLQDADVSQPSAVSFAEATKAFRGKMNNLLPPSCK